MTLSAFITRALNQLGGGFPDQALFKLGDYLNNITTGALTGNQLWVDAVNGNDATAVSGDFALPFLTVEAALAVAVAGDTVMLRPGIYNPVAGLTVPASVSIVGTTRLTSQIQMLNVVADTTLVTMGEGSSVESVTLLLTSTGHHTLKGVLFGGLTPETAELHDCLVEVDNQTASDLGTSDVAAIHVASTAPASNSEVQPINDCIGHAHSAGLGTKRGILLDTTASLMRTKNSTFSALRTGAGAGSYIGAEVNIAGGILVLQGGIVEGTSADMSQTAGSLRVSAVDLTNDNANGKGFTVLQSCPRFAWGCAAAPNSGTRYFYVGTAPDTANEVKTRLAAKGILKSLQVRSRIAPSAGHTDTFTVRKNGVDTGITVSLVDTAVSAMIDTVSVAFAAGDDISLKAVTSGGSTTSDVVCVAEIY
jgi:hypothetical protein